MLKYLAVAAAAFALAACAATPSGVDAGAPVPRPPAETMSGSPTASGQVAAPEVAAPAATPDPRPADGSIVVPGAPERPVPAPTGDPRSVTERMEDVRAWDQCVSRAQAVFENDPMRPQLDTPEDVCSRALGMADRLAVPQSRRR